jgi:hypothetical protein
MNAKKYLILSSRKILAAATSLENFLFIPLLTIYFLKNSYASFVVTETLHPCPSPCCFEDMVLSKLDSNISWKLF